MQNDASKNPRRKTATCRGDNRARDEEPAEAGKQHCQATLASNKGAAVILAGWRNLATANKGIGKMCWKHLKRFLAVLALVSSPVICVRLASQPRAYAQDAQAVSRVTISGTTKTPDGTPIPGATLKIIQPDTGQTYITWSDEKGNFDLRSIPVGHYRIEASQLGFEDAKAEFDLSTDKATVVPVAMKIATLEAINAANQPPAAARLRIRHKLRRPARISRPRSRQHPERPRLLRPNAAATPSTQAQNRGARGGTGQQGRGRGFQSVNVQGQGAAAGDQSAADSQDASGLGQAASADAGVVIQGSTGQAQSNFGFGSFGDFGNMSQTGGGVANASQGASGAQPGQDARRRRRARESMMVGPGGGGPGGGRGPGGGGRRTRRGGWWARWLEAGKRGARRTDRNRRGDCSA